MPVKRTLPTVGITDRNFRYRSSFDTDIARTFARLRREQKDAERQALAGQQALDLGQAVVHMPTRAVRGGK